jgi:pimeloyl-ACP methyl ester carboxylesterase
MFPDRFLPCAFAFAALAALGLAPAWAEKAPSPAKPQPCRLEGLAEEARCATYPAWEDRAAKKGRKIDLNVVILPALEPKPAPDPIFVFGGGPGEGIVGSAAHVAGWKELRRKREVVLIDQRGTGRSNPLFCPLYGDPPDFRKAAGDFMPVEAVRACREKLEKVADLRLYTTETAMDDIDEVRAWLGYAKINLYGISYGTRAAQVYLRQHPETVRSMVLAGVDPVDETGPIHHAYAGLRAVNLLLAECAADTACHTAFPRAKEELQAVMARVDQGVEVEVTDPRTGEKVKVRPSRGLVAEGIRFALYGDGSASLPLLIHRAFEGDLAPLVQRAIEIRLAIAQGIALGMYFSVTCAEDLPFITEEMTRAKSAGTLLGDYRVRQQKAACEVWPRGPLSAGFHELVRSDVPALLISGERDPVTPPEFVDRVAARLPNALHVVVPRGSHSSDGPCTEGLIRAFLDRGSAAGLDASCARDAAKTVFATQ